MDAALLKLYEDNLHPGAQELWRQAKNAGLHISLSAVKSWIQGQERHQEHAPNGMDKPKNWFKITDVPNSFAVDSILKGDFNKNKFGNQGYRGFLLFIELTTRKVYAFPFKTGSENSPPVAQEAKSLFAKFDAERKSEGHPVARLSGDNGKEFDNGLVQDFLHSKFITTYFHRPEDHRANGTLNIAARILNRQIGRTDWLSKLPTAVALWNKHTLRTVKSSPNVLESDKMKRQDVRFDALQHNHEVWERTHLAGAHPIVLRYLRRNTVDKGLFDKEGKNYTGDFQVEGRKGWSHLLRNPDGSSAGAYRPYELRQTGKAEFDKEQSTYRKQQAAMEENRREQMVDRKLKQELGGERAAPVKRAQRSRVAPAKSPAPTLKAPRTKVVDKTTIPQMLLDWDFGEGRKNKDALRFKVQWKPTPEFLAKWDTQKNAFDKWDVKNNVFISWWPYATAFKDGYSVETQNNFKPAEAKGLVADLVKRSVQSGDMDERTATIIQTRYGLL